MPGASKYNWEELKSRYMAGEFISTRQLATALKLPFSTIQTRAVREGWFTERKQQREKAEEEARRRIFSRLAQEAERRMSVILQSADALRFKAVEALSKKGLELTPTEAIRALRLATDIELEIFMGRGLKAARPLGGED